MKVGRDRFMDQGYLILRDVVPAGKLRAMRAAFKIALERQKAAWARDRKPSDPPGGMCETESQPRVMVERPGIIDKETANVVEDFCVADETLPSLRTRPAVAVASGVAGVAA